MNWILLIYSYILEESPEEHDYVEPLEKENMSSSSLWGGVLSATPRLSHLELEEHWELICL